MDVNSALQTAVCNHVLLQETAWNEGGVMNTFMQVANTKELNISGLLSLEVKRSERESYHSPPSSGELYLHIHISIHGIVLN
jgi:hypothetical protein